MRQKTPLTVRQLDRKAQWEERRAYIWAGVVVIAFCLIFGGYSALIARADEREWSNAPLQESEATCTRAQSISSRTMSGWANTFRIGEKELTSRDRDGCLIGRQYLLTYQIGRTGQLQVKRGNLL